MKNLRFALCRYVLGHKPDPAAGAVTMPSGMVRLKCGRCGVNVWIPAQR